jgi:multiple sugar transport system permease protein
MNFKHKYMFLLPGLLVLLGILIFPIGFTVRLSLSSWDSFYPALGFYRFGKLRAPVHG